MFNIVAYVFFFSVSKLGSPLNELGALLEEEKDCDC
ncbi:hypothetical protein T11_10327, partial [Trichinella zimbabwensis]